MGKQGPCNHCGVAVTPLWRNGPPEKPVLCNACGSRWRTRGTLVNYMPLHAGGLGLSSAAATKWRLKNPGARQHPHSQCPSAANGKRTDGEEDGGAEAQKGADAWLAEKGAGGTAQGSGARMGRGLRGRGPGVKRKGWQRARGGVRGGERSGIVSGCGMEGQSDAGLGRGANERWDDEMELDMVWGDDDDDDEKDMERSGGGDNSGARKGWGQSGGSGREGSEDVMRMEDDGSVVASDRLQGVPIPPKRRSLGGGGRQSSASLYGAGSGSGMRPRSQSEADLTTLRMRHSAGSGGGKEGSWREKGAHARGEKGVKREGDMDVDAGVQWNEEDDLLMDGGGGRRGQEGMREVWIEEGGDDEAGGGEEDVVEVEEEKRAGEEGEEEEEEGDEDRQLELLQHVPSGHRDLVLLTMPSPHYRALTTPSGAAGAGAAVGKGTREDEVGEGRGERVGMHRVASDGSIWRAGGRTGGMARMGEGDVDKCGMTGARKQGGGVGVGGREHAAVASLAEASGIVSDNFLLCSPLSPLCSVNLTDIVNASSLYRCMDHAHKCQLVAMLPAVDTANGSASVESMFRSKTFLQAVKNFQKLLAHGMFDASALPADTAQLFSSLTSTTCLDLSASGWWQRWGQAHASSASVSPAPPPAPTPPTPTPPPPPPQPSPSPPTPPAAASAAATATVIPPSVSAAAAAATTVSAVASTPATFVVAPSTISPAPAPAPAPVDSRASASRSAAHTPAALPALSTTAINGRDSSGADAASGAGAASPSGSPSANTAGAAAAGGHSGGKGVSPSLRHPCSVPTPSGPSPNMSTVPSSSPSAGFALRKCTTATASTTGPAACSSMGNGVAAADAAARGFSGVSGSQKKPPLGAQAMAAAPGVGAGHKTQRIPAATATAAVSIPAVSATTGALAVPARVTGMAAGKAAVVIPVQEQQQVGRRVAPVVPAGLGVGTGKFPESNDEDEEDGSFAAVCGHVKLPQQPNRNQASRDPSHFALSANFFSGSSLLSASPPTGTTTPSPPPFHTSVLPSNSTHPSSSTSPGSFPRVNQSASVTPAAAAPSSHGANTWQKLAAAAAARPAVSTAAPAAATSVSGKGGIAASISSRRLLGIPPPAAASMGALLRYWWLVQCHCSSWGDCNARATRVSDAGNEVCFE
ncbi:unnamed protein product [Closterium sp. NIES-53]